MKKVCDVGTEGDLNDPLLGKKLSHLRLAGNLPDLRSVVPRQILELDDNMENATSQRGTHRQPLILAQSRGMEFLAGVFSRFAL